MGLAVADECRERRLVATHHASLAQRYDLPRLERADPMRQPQRPISAITASPSPGLMCVMWTSTLPRELLQLVAERCRAEVPADAWRAARSSSLNAVSMTRWATSIVASRSQSAGFGPVSPVKTHQPALPPSTAKPTAGTVCARRQHLDLLAAELEHVARPRTARSAASAARRSAGA